MAHFLNKRIVVGGCLGAIGMEVSRFLFNSGAIVYGYDLLPPATGGGVGSERLHALDKGMFAALHHLPKKNEKEFSNFIQKLLDRNEAIDGLVCTQGVSGDISDAEFTNLDNFQECIENSVSSIALAVKHIAPVMKKKRAGSIVLVGSTASIRGVALMPAYNAAKHAVLGLNKSFARELGPWGIRVNIVLPGALHSPMQASIIERLEQRKNPGYIFEGFNDSLASNIPLKRLGQPAEIARSIAFFLSDESTYCTGAALTCDGGASIK